MAGSPSTEPEHVPVLADRVTALLAPALDGPGAVLVDATLGRAGHARALLEACPGLLLIGVDADLPAHPELHVVKVRRGTDSITHGPAMSRREAEQAIDAGRDDGREQRHAPGGRGGPRSAGVR